MTRYRMWSCSRTTGGSSAWTRKGLTLGGRPNWHRSMSWSPDPELRGYFKGTNACLSALFEAGAMKRSSSFSSLLLHKSWSHRRWGVKALLAMGKMPSASLCRRDPG